MLIALVVMTLFVGLFAGSNITVLVALHLEKREAEKKEAMRRHPVGGSTIFTSESETLEED